MAEYLFIHSNDDYKLPEDYHFSHNLCVRLYDQAVWLLKDGPTQKKVGESIRFRETDDKFEESKEHIFEWMLRNGYTSDVDNITAKHTFFSVVSDMCHFIYQSLHSSKNIKLTVALNLLRKPFLEHLIILEQLLVKEKEFLRKFETNPENFDPGKLSPEDKKNLINQCAEIIDSKFVMTDLLYELRFDKRNPDSIYANSNQATHLVTTRHASFKTEKQNLNFIFSDFDDWDNQLSYIYYFLPFLLNYSLEVIDAFLYHKKVIIRKLYKERKFYRFMALILHFDQFNKKSLKGRSEINTLLGKLKVECKACKRVNKIFKSDIYHYVHEDYLLCKHCLVDMVYESDSLRSLMNKMVSLGKKRG
ncbi:MAG: hypothetical protein ABJO02_01430 [Reichenbachiella sp.]|uniref:hypothetical protein n=1 Tax=Reichenbachiella sp. TaxID=2184521 RepID=UPI003298B13B